MLGKLRSGSPQSPESPKSSDVTIVGAGIGGLLAAYYLDQAGYRVRLIEAEERVGGLIFTQKTPLGIVESAAHSVPASPAIRELCQDLGVELCPLMPESDARWIYRNGKPRRIPLGPLELLKTFFRAYFVIAPTRDPETFNLEDWARKFLGESALLYLVTPFVRGIYGASPRDISVSAAFPGLCVPPGHSLLSFLLAKMWRRRKPPKGVKRNVARIPRGEMSAPRIGMQSLISALEARLVERLGKRFERGVRLKSLPAGEGNLMLCVPAREAGALIGASSPELSRRLEQVRYSSLTTATIFLDRRALKRQPTGIGILIPACEERNCLGILYNSSAFPDRVTKEGLVSLTMMLDPGKLDPKNTEDAALLKKVICRELEVVLGCSDGFSGEFSGLYIRQWERAIPLYDEHLLKTWECAEKSWCSEPGHLLFGNYTGQVSIRGMAEVMSAFANANRIGGAS